MAYSANSFIAFTANLVVYTLYGNFYKLYTVNSSLIFV